MEVPIQMTPATLSKDVGLIHLILEFNLTSRLIWRYVWFDVTFNLDVMFNFTLRYNEKRGGCGGR